MQELAAGSCSWKQVFNTSSGGLARNGCLAVQTRKGSLELTFSQDAVAALVVGSRLQKPAVESSKPHGGWHPSLGPGKADGSETRYERINSQDPAWGSCSGSNGKLVTRVSSQKTGGTFLKISLWGCCLFPTQCAS